MNWVKVKLVKIHKWTSKGGYHFYKDNGFRYTYQCFENKLSNLETLTVKEMCNKKNIY